MHRRSFLLGLIALPAFQKTAIPLPPLSYSCPMHPEVVDSSPGKCPICGMEMQKVRLALVWTCPVHSDITEPDKGLSPRCGRDLIRVTKAVSFTCPVHK